LKSNTFTTMSCTSTMYPLFVISSLFVRLMFSLFMIFSLVYVYVCRKTCRQQSGQKSCHVCVVFDISHHPKNISLHLTLWILFCVEITILWRSSIRKSSTSASLLFVCPSLLKYSNGDSHTLSSILSLIHAHLPSKRNFCALNQKSGSPLNYIHSRSFTIHSIHSFTYTRAHTHFLFIWICTYCVCVCGWVWVWCAQCTTDDHITTPISCDWFHVSFSFPFHSRLYPHLLLFQIWRRNT
jgi:hypothetical protein